MATKAAERLNDADWHAMIEEVGVLIAKLRTKPAHLKIGFRHSPGGILNAYREGDVTFDEAVSMLQVIPLFLSSYCEKKNHSACNDSRTTGFADNPCLLCKCECHTVAAAIRSMGSE